jgi:DNA repair photolyase
MQIFETQVHRILTRASGFLTTVCSHSLQPYRGCSLGNSLCGIGCYVQHNHHVVRGRKWGDFLEVRRNAAESYLECIHAERRWGRERRGEFAIFLSSSTEPFLPQERMYGVTRALLEAMLSEPPDLLIVQSHVSAVADPLELYRALQERCRLRVHVSIECDRDRIPGLPPHASPLAGRFAAASKLKRHGIPVVITVSPLLPIADPEAFFARIAECADAAVIDHFIQGDGSRDGQRTLRTPLPAAMAEIDPRTLTLEYREYIVGVARRHLPGKVGVNIDGFAARYLP